MGHLQRLLTEELRLLQRGFLFHLLRDIQGDAKYACQLACGVVDGVGNHPCPDQLSIIGADLLVLHVIAGNFPAFELFQQLGVMGHVFGRDRQDTEAPLLCRQMVRLATVVTNDGSGLG